MRIGVTDIVLTGSIKTTGTFVEQALAQANIRVIDDLAPSANRRHYDMEQAKLGGIIRSMLRSRCSLRSNTSSTNEVRG